MRRSLLCCALLGAAATANATVIYFDDFESYADTAAMASPGAWGDVQDVGQPPVGTLDLVNGNPNKAAFHPGGETNRHAIPPTTTGGGTMIWEFDFNDGGTSSNKRISGGLRVGNGTPLLEMGINNNSVLNPETGGSVAGYAIRTVGIGGSPSGVSGNGWVAFPGNPAVRAGWHHFRAIMNPTSILFELDFFDDGTVDASRLITTSNTSAIAWSTMRFGGTSDLSSPGGGALFDNMSLIQIPEPASLGLLLLGGALLRRRS